MEETQESVSDSSEVEEDQDGHLIPRLISSALSGLLTGLFAIGTLLFRVFPCDLVQVSFSNLCKLVTWIC